MKRFTIQGVEINCDSLNVTAQRIINDCNTRHSFTVFTLNLDHIVKLKRDPDFRSAYKNARYVTADGMPIAWAGRLLGSEVQRVTGADLIEPLCEKAAAAGHSVYLFGSQFKSLAGAAQHLTARYPNLEVAGVCAPEENFDPTSASAAEQVRNIAESGAKICFVALGAPKQELFSTHAVSNTNGIAFVCIGAGLDFLSGYNKRAPAWVGRIGAEWLWRLVSDPKRLWRRYLDCALALPTLLSVRLVK